MQLKFPPLAGGTVSGLNDAGIETFEGDFATNVVRECVQNSLDAVVDHSKPVTVSISWHSLPVAQLHFAGQLVEVLGACGDFWRGNAKAKSFFRRAADDARALTLDALRISDSNTTGLDGADDDIDGRWFGLVKSRGVSNQKESGSGGAFGIGKDAPLAGSQFRTVLYSTKTLAGDVAFQGVSRLVTHRDVETGKETQGTGFIGKFDQSGPRFLAIRHKDEIPEQFLRTEPGLDVWVLGCRVFKENWELPFIRSALANFWPAVIDKKVRLVIGSKTIDHENLAEWMRRERNDDLVSDAYPYYRAVEEKDAKVFHERLPHAGACRLHLLAGKKDLPRRVCLVRKTGMVITEYQPRVAYLPFSGLFVCDDPAGNQRLRSLEPPRHDKWDISRAETPDARAALLELRDWIKETIRKEIPAFDADQFNETAPTPELTEQEESEPLPPVNEGQNEPDLGGAASQVSPTEVRKVTTVPTRRSPGQQTPGTTGEGEGVRGSGSGDGENTGGRTKTRGPEAPKQPSQPVVPNITSRAFITPEDDDVYEVVVRSDGDYEGAIYIDAIGENGANEALPLLAAAAADGEKLEVDYNRIKSVRISKDIPSRIGIRFKTPGKYSLRASLS